MRRLLLAAGLAVGALAGCGRERQQDAASRLVPAPPGVVLRGRLVEGFESSDFQICGTREHWWLTPPMDAAGAEAWGRAMRRVGLETPSRPGLLAIYLVVRADTVSGGRYGHLGGAVREVRVREVIEASASVPADCAVDSLR